MPGNFACHFGGAKPLPHHTISKLEDRPDVSAHEQEIRKPTERSGILHVIANDRSPVALLKGVLVFPIALGAFGLFIDKSEWRLPDGDHGPPTHW